MPRGKKVASKTIWTVGHSNLDLETFLDRLREVELLADIRRYPHSPRSPHFDGASLAKVKEYRWIPELGGRRKGGGERHTAWRVAAFRAYAGYMETAAFRQGLSVLQEIALKRRTAILCAETLWWRCHRRLVSDALVAAGWRVIHLPARDLHELSPLARIEKDGSLVYDQRSPSPRAKRSLPGD
jgi:uncharacterized protein (DUF488 family)